METTSMRDAAPELSTEARARGLDVVERGRRDFVAAYENEGFAVVKGLFSLDEVLTMRTICADVFARTGGKIGDLATYPELRNILLDDRVLAVARAALGDSIVYFGDSNFYANSRFDRHIHSDARGDVEDPSRSQYPILRIGLYLQDHTFHSNGLKVRPRSHRTVLWTVRNGLRIFGVGGNRLSLRAFRPCWYYNVPTEPGDLVFWNLRTHHAGHALRLRGLDGVALPPSWENVLPARAARPMPRDRYAIFMSLGRESPELEAYIKHIGYLQRSVWERSSFDTAAAREAFDRKNVKLRADVLRLAQLGA